MRFENGLELRGTTEHPFYVKGKGWTPLGELSTGDICFDREQKPVVVMEIVKDGKQVEVFNIEVEGCHTYYIGNGELTVLVHNLCSCYSLGHETAYCGCACHEGDPRRPIENPYSGSTYVKDIKGKAVEAVSHWDFWLYLSIPFPQSSKKALIKDYNTNLPIVNISNTTSKGVEAGKGYIDGCGPSSFEYLGASGMEPCVGIVIYSASAQQRAAFHFHPNGSSPALTLDGYSWPRDSVAFIAGGNTDPWSRRLLSMTINALNNKGIEIRGYSFSSGVFCDRKGNFVVGKQNVYRPSELLNH